MADAATFTPYSTVAAFLSALPGWVPEEEKQRIASYGVYEEIYWNHPTTFKLVLRGGDTKPLYIPSGRTIVDAICRFTAKGFAAQYLGDDTQKTGQLAFEALFARERFRSKLTSGKKMGSIRGDWVLHVTADPLKPQGQRLSLHLVDAASYFPVYDEATETRIIKVHLAEQFLDAGGNPRVRRQTYTKLEDGTIQSELAIFEIDKWSGEAEGPAVEQVVKPFVLPPAITSIPVYHFRNGVVDDLQPYGNSDMRGIERVMAGLNQAMSDEDLALALEGLGLYKTANGAPLDENDEETDWILGPGRVVEDESFERVPGIGSVAPYGDHIDRIDRFMKEAAGVPSAAIGKVDVQVAESGVALALEMLPLLTKASDNEDALKDILTQLFYDLHTMWFPAYEQMSFETLAVLPTFTDPLPVNVKQEIANVTTMMSSVPPILSAATAREYLTLKIGFQFAADEVARIVQEQQLATAASAPVGEDDGTDFAARTRAEMEADTDAESA